MSKLKTWLLHPLFLAVLGGLALSGLVWWGAPLIRWNEERPLEGLGWRLGLIGGVWALIALTVGLAWLRRRRAHAALLKGMGDSGAASAREEAELQQRFDEALAVLKKSPGAKAGLGADALDALPWYVFLGAPGSGKTTALLNAGLNFPLTEKLGQASVRGVGGTRNCEWWFSDEAVLIDTAGRYATQDSDKDSDAAAWAKFLDLLRGARPRQPINGVLLTVSVADLLTSTPEERKTQAAKLRGRMQELQQRLGVNAPVYVLVTKADLIAGFNESFAALGAEARNQVFGFTYPLATSQTGDVMAEFAGEFAALEKRLRERLLERMEAESDPLKRATVFAFPQQFAGLRGLLGAWLEAVFGGSGSLDERPLLRGVYFTSGTQEGTPIDRVLGTLARTFGVERKLAAMPAGRGKSYFLNRLLREVVFAESGLAGGNAAVEKRQKLLRRTGLALTGLTAVALLAGWGFSYVGNQRYIAEVEARLPDLTRAVDALPPASGSDLSGVPVVLAQVRDAAQPGEKPFDLGLYQGRKLDAGAQMSYQRLLERSLAPRVARRLEERLRSANRDNLEFAYEALKAYVMLYQPEHLEPNGFKDWVSVDWDVNLANSLGPDQLSSLKSHLDAWVAGGNLQVAQPMDKTLVAAVRDMLGAFPLEYRIFSRLKRIQLGRELPEWTVAAAAGPQSPNVFVRASGQPLTKGVPGMFTRDGYKQAFESSLGRTAKQLAEEEVWVLGSTASQKKGVTDPELPQRVRRLYLEEYVKVWDGFMADVKLIKLGSLEQGVNVARLLSAVDSPLAAYLRAASRETTLIEAPAAPTAVGAAAASLEQRAKEVAMRQRELQAMVGNQPRPQGSIAGDGPIERIVDDHFAPLRRMVTGTPAPLDDVLKLFGEVYVQLSAVDAAAKSKTAPAGGGGGGGGAKMKAAAGQQPEPVRSMLESLAAATDNQSRLVERQSLTDEIKPVTDFCARAVAGRYPVAPGAKADIQPDDFAQLFAPQGLLDEFFQRKLAPLVDIGTTPWSFKPTGDGGRPVAPAALADFQRADKIRQGFFRGGGRTPGFVIDVRVLEFSDGLKEITLDTDGQITKLVPGGGPPVTINWPGSRPTSQLRLASLPASSPLLFEGPWALFRLFDRFEVQATPAQPERFTVIMNLDNHKARLEITARSVINPLRLRELQQFRCPGAL